MGVRTAAAVGLLALGLAAVQGVSAAVQQLESANQFDMGLAGRALISAGPDALSLSLVSPPQRGLTHGSAAGDCRQSREIARKVFGCSILIEREAGNPVTFFRRAEAYQEMDHHSEAVADYSVAISLDPGYAHAFLGRARSHQAKGNLAAAIADFSAALRLNPVFARAHVGRAQALEAAGRLTEAIADYRAALALDAAYEEARTALARLARSAARP